MDPLDRHKCWKVVEFDGRCRHRTSDFYYAKVSLKKISMFHASPLFAAIEVYFEAKAHLFRYAAEAKILDVGPLKCLHRHPGWPEIDGFYAVDVEPQEAIKAIREYRPHRQHMLTVVTSSPELMSERYAKQGYQLGNEPAQPLMRKSLVSFESDAAAFPVRRVETHQDLTFVNTLEEYMNPAHLTDPAFRYYYIRMNDVPVCRGRAITTSNNAIYIAGMDTLTEYRCRGLATALMNRMHADGVQAGVQQSVLCASPQGYTLYQKLGYETLAGMHTFLPQGTMQ